MKIGITSDGENDTFAFHLMSFKKPFEIHIHIRYNRPTACGVSA